MYDLTWLRKLCEERRIPLIRRDTEEALKEILLAERPRRILEIGTAIGYSACFMAKTLKEEGLCPEIITVEISPRSYEDAGEAVERLGLAPYIRRILGDGAEVIPTLRGPFDFAFLDAAKSRYGTYFTGIRPLMREGGIIAADNVALSGMVLQEEKDFPRRERTSVRAMKAFLKEIQTDPALETRILYDIGDGLAVCRVKGRP